MTVTKQTLIGDILDHDVQTAQFFFEIGMHCLGCPHSRGESIEDACLVHGTDADELIVIDKKTIAERGTPEELIKQKGIYYTLYKMQTEALKTIGISED